MKHIEVSDSLAIMVKDLQRDMTVEKDNIANSLSTLSALVNLGRDEEAIAPWTDDLLKVMYTLSDYNELLNTIANNTRSERFTLSE